jgi:hypothetical protein
MKKIKLTEATLKRIVERVIEEQELVEDSDKMKELVTKLQKNPNDEELKNELINLSKKLGLPTKEN